MEERMLNRLVGVKEIMPVLHSMYRWSDWKWAKECIKRDRMPLHYTPSGIPYFIWFELIEHDARFREIMESATLLPPP